MYKEPLNVVYSVHYHSSTKHEHEIIVYHKCSDTQLWIESPYFPLSNTKLLIYHHSPMYQIIKKNYCRVERKLINNTFKLLNTSELVTWMVIVRLSKNTESICSCHKWPGYLWKLFPFYKLVSCHSTLSFEDLIFCLNHSSSTILQIWWTIWCTMLKKSSKTTKDFVIQKYTKLNLCTQIVRKLLTLCDLKCCP